MPVPVSAPPRVASRLQRAADGPRRILHRSRDAVYADLDGWCLGIVTPRAVQVPCALRSRLGHLDLEGPAQPRDRLYVAAGGIAIGGTPLVIGRIHDTTVPRSPSGVNPSAAGPVEVSASPLASPAGPAGQPMTPALVVRLVGRLLGRGGGLTPLGDDVLSGWLVAHRAAGVPTPEVDGAVRALLPRTTLLSATLLDCALHGEALPEAVAYLAAVGTPEQPVRAAALRAVGHSSGSGLLRGIDGALAALDRAAA